MVALPARHNDPPPRHSIALKAPVVDHGQASVRRSRASLGLYFGFVFAVLTSPDCCCRHWAEQEPAQWERRNKRTTDLDLHNKEGYMWTISWQGTIRLAVC